MEKQMLRKTIALVLATLFLAIPMLGISTLAEEGSSTAKVKFKEGVLKWGDATMKNMALDFGEHTVPASAQTYNEVTDADRSTTVEDARSGEGADQKDKGFSITVSMTSFEKGVSSFKGVVNLPLPTCVKTSTCTVTPYAVAVTSGDVTGKKVAEASADSQGLYTFTWAKKTPTLFISDGEALNVEVGEYQATLTWMLAGKI